MFDQLLMPIRRFELWIVALHIRLTVIGGADFRKDQEPAVFWAIPQEIDGVAEDSTAEVPVPKVKTAIRTGEVKWRLIAASVLLGQVVHGDSSPSESVPLSSHRDAHLLYSIVGPSRQFRESQFSLV
jgi:hypothetical protein